MRLTLTIDDKVAAGARARLRASGKSLNQEIRDHLRCIAEAEDLERDIETFVKLSGHGSPEADWKWSRNQLYDDRLKCPRE